MILESLVTSIGDDSRVNLAPMGPIVQGDLTLLDVRALTFTLRPFVSSRTFVNLSQSRRAVIHVTDDAMLIARAAVGRLEDEDVASRVHRLEGTDWWPLVDCHRWFAIEIESIEHDELRSEMKCKVVRSEVVRPFFGFNRAKHAVLEAAILATRTHLLSPEVIREEMKRLVPLIDKTAGPVEHEAFEMLRRTIDDRLANPQTRSD